MHCKGHGSSSTRCSCHSCWIDTNAICHCVLRYPCRFPHATPGTMQKSICTVLLLVTIAVSVAEATQSRGMRSSTGCNSESRCLLVGCVELSSASLLVLLHPLPALRFWTCFYCCALLLNYDKCSRCLSWRTHLTQNTHHPTSQHLFDMTDHNPGGATTAATTAAAAAFQAACCCRRSHTRRLRQSRAPPLPHTRRSQRQLESGRSQ